MNRTTATRKLATVVAATPAFAIANSWAVGAYWQAWQWQGWWCLDMPTE